MPRRQPTATASARPRLARRSRIAAILLSLAVILWGAAPPTARAGAGWRLPVDGDVVGGFRVTPGAPFAAGQRRGIDLRARPGAPVRAACSGRVRYAGAVPGRRLGVTVRCARGPWVATHLGLGGLLVRAGRHVVGGATFVGRAGPSGSIRLGARRDGSRHGYIDPLLLLGGAEGPVHLAPPPGLLAPRAAGPRRPRPGPRPAPRASATALPSVPALAWLGLALVAAGAPLTLAGRARRRRRVLATGRAAPHR